MAYEVIDINEASDGGQSVTVAYEQEEGDGLYQIQPEGMFADPSGTFDPVTLDELNEVATAVLGTVNNIAPVITTTATATAGKIDRVMPYHHPMRTSLSATAVNFVGIGDPYLGNALIVPGLSPIKARTTLYPQYRLAVKYSRHPYYLVSNDFVERKPVTYYKPDGTSVLVYTAAEWLRYCTRTQVPNNESIDSQHGAVTLRTQSGSAPNGNQFTGSPFLSLQNQTVEVTWYRVPYRYLFEYYSKKPYLTRFTDTVNQNAWWDYQPGQLLYLGCIPSTPYAAPGFYVDGTGTDQYMLCDIKLNFLLTTRQGTDVPNSGNSLLTNKNRIAAGHNLMPNFGDRKFYYYASSPGDRPTFDSFEFGLLFTDPMLAQAEDI